jgi:hypothetical protein
VSGGGNKAELAPSLSLAAAAPAGALGSRGTMAAERTRSGEQAWWLPQPNAMPRHFSSSKRLLLQKMQQKCVVQDAPRRASWAARAEPGGTVETVSVCLAAAQQRSGALTPPTRRNC